MNLSKAEEKLFIRKPANLTALGPICLALKLASYETAFIADVMRILESDPELPEYFSIVNNRYLTRLDKSPYDLVRSEYILGKFQVRKSMALTFWLDGGNNAGKAKG